jgi:hypothetical protein
MIHKKPIGEDSRTIRVSRLVLWFLLTVGLAFSALAGVNTMDTAMAGSYFSGLALLLQWILSPKDDA